MKKKKIYQIILGIFLLCVLFYFSKPIGWVLSYAATSVFKPVIIVGQHVGNGISNLKVIFISKKTLIAENENLKQQLQQVELTTANYYTVQNENNDLKEILGRKKENENMLISSILAKPNRSPYGTLIIDVGEKHGALINKKVFAYGNIPIGKVVEVYPSSSKVILYSSPGEKTDVVVAGKGVYLEAIGRGNGNFEIILPKDFSIDNGTEVVLPGITPRVLATVVKTLTDSRDTYVKALLTSPVNVQTLSFVEIER